MEWGTIVAAAITALASFFGVYVANRKQTALMAYRLEQLEHKQDVHNRMIERVYILEGKMTEAEHEINDLKGRAS
jgi:hypothetical protein